MIEAHNLAGQKFNMLTVIAPDGKQGKKRLWLCKCDCGNFSRARTDQLRRETTKSCGCLQRKVASQTFKKHGLSQTGIGKKLYKVWAAMKQRCLNAKAQNFHRYGGRGITVCPEWKEDFQPFYDWAMANGYQEGLEIDRANNDGNYEPSNCRWVTHKINANNRHQNNQYGIKTVTK